MAIAVFAFLCCMVVLLFVWQKLAKEKDARKSQEAKTNTNEAQNNNQLEIGNK